MGREHDAGQGPSNKWKARVLSSESNAAKASNESA